MHVVVPGVVRGKENRPYTKVCITSKKFSLLSFLFIILFFFFSLDYTQSTSPRRSKRPSIEPTDSLEELIGSPIIKEEPTISTLPPPSSVAPRSVSPVAPLSVSPKAVSPVSPTTERMSRLKVMTIGFLCGSDQEPVIEPERRISDCPLLDLLVDAVMDVEYMEEKASRAVTVVVNPEIHRDATHRVLYQQQLKKKQTSPSLPFNESNESKADSAVSLSPRFPEKKDEDRCWRREMDDGLFSKEDEDRLMDDFFDDVSDLSSVGSSAWSSDEEDEVPVKPTKRKPTQITTIQDLACIACAKPLKKQDISEQVGADMSITNELATWTWSPSAIFTDWRPKRCPRCERHFTIFKQEWPNRKIKKKKALPNKKSKKNKKSSSPPSAAVKKSLSRPCSPFPTKAVAEINQKSPIYQMQDDPQDLNYIPPSPLSEVVYDDTFP